MNFKRTVLGLDRCCLAHESMLHCDGSLDAHHAIPQQVLRKHALHEHLWDVRNGISVCRHAHEQHHSRYRPIPFSCLPERTLEFAREFGFTEYLQRMYA